MSSGLVDEIRGLAKESDIHLISFSRIPGREMYLRPENRDYLYDSGYVWAISLASHISESACDLLPMHNAPGMIQIFHKHTFGKAGDLDRAAQKIAALIEKNGHKALVISGRGRSYFDEGDATVISHKALGVLSGMGTVGDSGLLITKEYGPRVRLCTVITSLPLPVEEKAEPVLNNCIHCGKCAKICPSGAVGGERFDPKNPKRGVIDYNACDTYRTEREPRMQSRFCNLCMYVCPVGKDRKNQKA
jgi:ferredoxin